MVSRKTGKPKPEKTRRLRKDTATAAVAAENERFTLGKLSNRVVGFFANKDDARAIRHGRTISKRFDHPTFGARTRKK